MNNSYGIKFLRGTYIYEINGQLETLKGHIAISDEALNSSERDEHLKYAKRHLDISAILKAQQKTQEKIGYSDILDAVKFVMNCRCVSTSYKLEDLETKWMETYEGTFQDEKVECDGISVSRETIEQLDKCVRGYVNSKY